MKIAYYYYYYEYYYRVIPAQCIMVCHVAYFPCVYWPNKKHSAACLGADCQAQRSVTNEN